jgi:amidohydrolase
MVSEDFSEYGRLVPACFMLVGSGNAELGLNAPHHNPRFDFDERALPIGAALLAAAATKFLLEGPALRLRSGQARSSTRSGPHGP